MSVASVFQRWIAPIVMASVMMNPLSGNPTAASGEAANPRATPAGRLLDADVVAQYTELKFADLFALPAGPKGLEYTDAARRLAGERVRLTGFMVRTVSLDPNVFMFAAHPVATDIKEYGLADDVPPNVAHAILPPREGCGTTWQPYEVTVFGVLELGGRQEQDGRISHVRIRAEHVTVGAARELIDVMRPHAQRLFRR